MVDAITPVSASSATTPVRVESSLSITSQPDNRWVAERQSQIDADQVAQKNGRAAVAVDDPGRPAEPEEEELPLFEGHARQRQARETSHFTNASDYQTESALLSGESESIGTTNFDEKTPFGDRAAIV